jgi:hypothetical protein
VMEAGAALRVSRTTAYAMAHEWRETGGKSGLPVIKVGHVLRVPRPALEQMIEAKLQRPGEAEPRSASEKPQEPQPVAASVEPEAAPTPATTRTRRPRPVPPGQTQLPLTA